MNLCSALLIAAIFLISAPLFASDPLYKYECVGWDDDNQKLEVLVSMDSWKMKTSWSRIPRKMGLLWETPNEVNRYELMYGPFSDETNQKYLDLKYDVFAFNGMLHGDQEGGILVAWNDSGFPGSWHRVELNCTLIFQ